MNEFFQSYLCIGKLWIMFGIFYLSFFVCECMVFNCILSFCLPNFDRGRSMREIAKLHKCTCIPHSCALVSDIKQIRNCWRNWSKIRNCWRNWSNIRNCWRNWNWLELMLMYKNHNHNIYITELWCPLLDNSYIKIKGR